MAVKFDTPSDPAYRAPETDAEFLEREQRHHAEMVAAQSWAKFWRDGHSARYDELPWMSRQLITLQHGEAIPAPDSRWRIVNGEAIPVG